MEQAALILEAASINKHALLKMEEFKKIVTSYPLEDIILGCLAIHRQYPEDKECHFFNDKQKKLKMKALDEGFCKENPTQCYIYHVYCNIIQNQLANTSSFLERSSLS